MTRIPEMRELESGGHLTRGGVYYSAIKPKGVQDTLTFQQKEWDLANSLLSAPEAGEAQVRKVQKWLTGIGYLDKGEIDGFLGQKTRGAIKRYRINFNDHTSDFNVWQTIKGKLDNMFQGE